MSAAAKWILTLLAQNIVAVLWWLGDLLFDLTVTQGRGQTLRDAALRKWTLKCQKADAYEPTTKRQKTWKQNKLNVYRETGEFMGFLPYVTLPERAERMIRGGGVHQP